MTNPDTTPDEQGPRPQFSSMPDWVAGWLGEVVANHFDVDHLWCAQWWCHNEVVLRFESLWRGWEAARISTDALAMSSWWVYHFDAHWRAITAAHGPLNLCTPERHTPTPTVPHMAPPPGWFTPTSSPPTDPDDDVNDLDAPPPDDDRPQP